MRHFTFLFCLFNLLALSACSTEPGANDDDDVPELPSIIPSSWFTGASGTILNRKEYVSGALDGESCTESFGVTGVNVTDALPDICSSCDLYYTVYMGLEAGTDCNGGADLDEEGKMAFDLRQETDEAILYWYSESWWDAEWVEMGTGTLVRNDDNLTFDFHFDWEDPDNGEWAGNWSSDDPCSWSETCSWNGFYTSDLTISFDWDGTESNPTP